MNKHKNASVRVFKIFGVTISAAVLYLCLFVLLPAVLPNIYPVSNEATVLFLCLNVFEAVIAAVFYTDRLLRLLAGNIVYGVLILLYNANGAYGIGKVGMSLDGMNPIYSLGAAVTAVLLIIAARAVLQILTFGIKAIAHRYRLKL